jgi:hypothetical protein
MKQAEAAIKSHESTIAALKTAPQIHRDDSTGWTGRDWRWGGGEPQDSSWGRLDAHP